MPPKLKPVQHDDQLTLVEHLDELRSRLFVTALAVAVAGGLCYWQNHLIFDILDRPLDGRELITLSPTEPFLTTLTLSFYASLLISLPVLLYQLYAFILPAFSPTERRVAVPLLLMVPVLFIAGVLFCYFIVLAPAIDFLTSFNADEFNTQLRARDYYSFTSLTMMALGLLFQVPIGILALTRLGITTPDQLRKNRRYAYVVIAVLAAMLPTIDPITLMLEIVPIVVLYEASILLAAAFGKPSPEVAERLASAEGA